MLFGGVNAHKETTDAVAKHGAKWLRSKHADWTLAAISFVESVFAPIIIDPFLVALIFASPKRWKWFIIISILASLVGGIFAYYLGALFFDAIGQKIINFYGLHESFAWIAGELNKSAFVFVFLGAFTPIPYKLVALGSGMLHINIITFVVASIIGRMLRLGLVGVAAHAVGPHALPIVRRYLYHIAAIAGVLLLAYLLIQLFHSWQV